MRSKLPLSPKISCLSKFTLQLRAILMAGLLFGSWAFYSQHAGPRIGPMRGRLLSSEQVTTIFISKAGTKQVKHGFAVDRLYFAPSVSEVHRLIELFKNDLEYTTESYDCDDFSRRFKDRLLHQWAKEGHQYPLPIAEVYGVIVFSDGTAVYHAFNAIVTAEGKLIYIEPQLPRAIHFRRAKLVTISDVNI